MILILALLSIFTFIILYEKAMCRNVRIDILWMLVEYNLKVSIISYLATNILWAVNMKYFPFYHLYTTHQCISKFNYINVKQFVMCCKLLKIQIKVENKKSLKTEQKLREVIIIKLLDLNCSKCRKAYEPFVAKTCFNLEEK